MRLVALDKNEREVREGDTILSFRGESFTFYNVHTNGKVIARQEGHDLGREYFPSVFGLTIEERE